MSLTCAPDAIADEVLIRTEIEAMDEVSTRKGAIIIQAAEKLATKYQNNPTVICGKLQKIWGTKISRAYIYQVLPPTFRREYKQAPKETAADIPKTAFQELLTRLADASREQAQVFDSINQQCQDDPDLEKELTADLEKTIGDFHTNFDAKVKELAGRLSKIRHLKGFIDLVKDMELEVDACKNLVDKRRKFSTALKLTFKIMIIYKSYNDIATSLNLKRKFGAKWISHIDHDKNLQQLITHTSCCPACGWDYALWLEKAASNQKLGFDIDPIPIRQPK